METKESFDMTGTGLGQTGGMGSPVNTGRAILPNKLKPPVMARPTPAQPLVPPTVTAPQLVSPKAAVAPPPAAPPPAPPPPPPGAFKPSPLGSVPMPDSPIARVLMPLHLESTPQLPPFTQQNQVATGTQSNTMGLLAKKAQEMAAQRLTTKQAYPGQPQTQQNPAWLSHPAMMAIANQWAQVSQQYASGRMPYQQYQRAQAMLAQRQQTLMQALQGQMLSPGGHAAARGGNPLPLATPPPAQNPNQPNQQQAQQLQQAIQRFNQLQNQLSQYDQHIHQKTQQLREMHENLGLNYGGGSGGAGLLGLGGGGNGFAVLVDRWKAAVDAQLERQIIEAVNQHPAADRAAVRAALMADTAGLQRQRAMAEQVVSQQPGMVHPGRFQQTVQTLQRQLSQLNAYRQTVVQQGSAYARSNPHFAFMWSNHMEYSNLQRQQQEALAQGMAPPPQLMDRMEEIQARSQMYAQNPHQFMTEMPVHNVGSMLGVMAPQSPGTPGSLFTTPSQPQTAAQPSAPAATPPSAPASPPAQGATPPPAANTNAMLSSGVDPWTGQPSTPYAYQPNLSPVSASQPSTPASPVAPAGPFAESAGPPAPVNAYGGTPMGRVQAHQTPTAGMPGNPTPAGFRLRQAAAIEDLAKEAMFGGGAGQWARGGWANNPTINWLANPMLATAQSMFRPAQNVTGQRTTYPPAVSGNSGPYNGPSFGFSTPQQQQQYAAMQQRANNQQQIRQMWRKQTVQNTQAANQAQQQAQMSGPQMAGKMQAQQANQQMAGKQQAQQAAQQMAGKNFNQQAAQAAGNQQYAAGGANPWTGQAQASQTASNGNQGWNASPQTPQTQQYTAGGSNPWTGQASTQPQGGTTMTPNSAPATQGLAGGGSQPGQANTRREAKQSSDASMLLKAAVGPGFVQSWGQNLLPWNMGQNMANAVNHLFRPSQNVGSLMPGYQAPPAAPVYGMLTPQQQQHQAQQESLQRRQEAMWQQYQQQQPQQQPVTQHAPPPTYNAAPLSSYQELLQPQARAQPQPLSVSSAAPPVYVPQISAVSSLPGGGYGGSSASSSGVGGGYGGAPAPSFGNATQSSSQLGAKQSSDLSELAKEAMAFGPPSGMGQPIGFGPPMVYGRPFHGFGQPGSMQGPAILPSPYTPQPPQATLPTPGHQPAGAWQDEMRRRLSDLEGRWRLEGDHSALSELQTLQQRAGQPLPPPGQAATGMPGASGMPGAPGMPSLPGTPSAQPPGLTPPPQAAAQYHAIRRQMQELEQSRRQQMAELALMHHMGPQSTPELEHAQAQRAAVEENQNRYRQQLQLLQARESAAKREHNEQRGLFDIGKLWSNIGALFGGNTTTSRWEKAKLDRQAFEENARKALVEQQQTGLSASTVSREERQRLIQQQQEAQYRAMQEFMARRRELELAQQRLLAQHPGLSVDHVVTAASRRTADTVDRLTSRAAKTASMALGKRKPSPQLPLDVAMRALSDLKATDKAKDKLKMTSKDVASLALAN